MPAISPSPAMTVRRFLFSTRSLVLFVLTSAVMGAGLDGVVSSAAYLFSRRSPSGDELLHLRMHESFRLTYRPAGLENLRIEASGVTYLDPLNPATQGDPAFFLYGASVQYRRLLSLLDVTAGRFFVYDPSNAARIDGLKIAGSLPRGMTYTLYGGGFVQGAGEMSNPVHDHLVGLHISVPLWSRTVVDLAVSQKALERETYRRDITPIEVPDLAERRLGIQVNTTFRSWTLFLRVVEDLQHIETQDANLALNGSWGPFHRVTVEYLFRRPRIPYNSIFSVFDARTNQEIALSGDMELTRRWQLFSRIRTVLLSDTSTVSVTVGGRTKAVSTSYRFQGGYGGTLHMVTLDGRYRPLPRWLILGTLEGGRYDRLEGSWENLITATGGFSYRPMKRLAVRMDVHLLQNRTYAADSRLFVTVNYVLP